MTYVYLEEDVVEDKRLGRHVNHDPVSRQYAYKSDIPLTAPLVSVEHVLNVGVLDQGNIGSCVPNTGVEAVSASMYYDTLPADIKSSLGEELAIQWYREVTRSDPFEGAWEPDDTGSDGLSLAKLLKSKGIISGYTHTFDPATALVALQKFPLLIGIMWLSGCDRPNADGVISYSGIERGGHELLVVGYDAVKQLVKIRNHWTARWGKDGHCFMTVADFNRAIQNQGDVIVLTPLTAAPPVPTPLVDKPTEADVALVTAMEPWSRSIISRLTKSGKANEAYKLWKEKKGFLTPL